jgi:putative DNA primase/helicase
MRDGAAIAARLGGRRSSKGWSFCCPCHSDRVASCSVRDDGLLTCFAGCPRKDLGAALDALGFPDDGQASTTRIKDDVPERVAAAAEMWKDALDDPNYVGAYLRTRGIVLPVPKALRRYRRGYIAAVQRFDGVLTAVQTKGTSQKGKTYGWLTDGAVRLMPITKGELGLAEGVESALSATQLHGIPCWAVLGARRLEKISLPEQVKRLHLFPDNDEPGQAATQRAVEHYSYRLEVKTWWPPQNQDWNDVLKGKKNGQ